MSNFNLKHVLNNFTYYYFYLNYLFCFRENIFSQKMKDAKEEN